MASTIESSQSGKFVEFDEYIDYQLEKTRNSIKWTDILTTLAGIAALMLGYLFLFQIFDHWVVAGGLGVTTRFVLLSTLLIVSAVWIVWKVVLPWWKQIHALYAARMIEQHSPGLKSSLLNLIDLRTSGRETSPHIRNALEKRSATALSHIDIEHAIDRRGLLRTSYVLLAIVILCSLYALFSPKPMSFLRPLTWADIAPATRTVILEVVPGSTEVPARVPVDIRVVVGGEAPQEVAFHYTTQDRTFVDERLLLSQIEDKPNEFQLPFAGENGAGLTQSIEYYITAGDAVSETYRLSVVLAPSATIEQIEYQYPAYTELEPRTQPTPPIDAIEGTQVTIFAHTGDVPVTSAVLELLDSDDENSSSAQIPVTITDGTQLRASWKLGFRNDGTYAREYRIRCETAEGLTEMDPARYPIVIRPDIPPEVALLDPPGDLERPANAVIPLVFKARDPDFNVSYVTLRVEKDGEELRSYPLFDGSKKVVVDRFRWELEPLRLVAGDVLTFYAEARDNKLPFGNRKTSSPLKLTIIEPVTSEEAKQQQKEDEQQQEPELREEQQQAAAENGEPTEEGSEGGSDENQQPSDDEKSKGETKDQEGEGETNKDQSGTSDSEQGTTGEKEKGDSSPDKQETETGNDDQPGENESGEGPGDRPLEADGTDDAEALEKIIENQKKQAEQNQQKSDQPSPEKGDQPSDQTQKGSDPNGKQPENEQENKGPDAPSKDQPKGPQEPGEKDGAGGEKQPADKNDTEEPEQTGKGKGTDSEKSDDSKDETDQTLDQKEKGTPTDEPGKPNEKPAEKRPGDPATKGPAKPDEKPDPNAPRSEEDIEREPGTKPSTVPSKDPKNTEPAEKRNEQPADPNGAKPDQKPAQKPNANDPPKGDDPPNPGEGDPQQKSKKPDSGEQGRSQEATEGTSDKEGTGKGDPSDKPGDSKENPGDSKEGEPGSKDENGNKTEPGNPGDNAGKGEKSDNADGAGGAKGESESESSGGTPSPDSTGNGGGAAAPPQNGATAPGAGDGAKTGDNPPGGASGTPEPGNLDDARQATDLTLKKLEEDLQRGEVDEKLLKELGWTEEQMQEFADRLRRQLERDSKGLSPEDQLKQRQFEEMLKNMNFNPDLSNRPKKNVPNRATESFGGRRTPIPLEHREAYEAFTREISKRKRK